MRFTKMHGCGNDYIYVNCFEETVDNPAQLVKQISDRHKGIGSDGLVLIMPSKVADFRMRMFNPDGSESEMCGNASRCVGKYVYDKGLTKQTLLTLETGAGLKRLQLYPEDGVVHKVCVDMGEPILQPEQIPVNLPLEQTINCKIDFDPEIYRINCVSMGNPHAVIFTEGIDSIPLETIGKKIEYFPLFPKRTNVEFVERLSSSHVRARVWERGTGETQACGTGACAILVAGFQSGRMDRIARVSLPGGELLIEWRVLNNHIYMTGEAVTVFEGII